MIIKSKNPESIKKSIEILKSGGIIAIPTDTIYGLACDALNEKAVKRLYELKSRQKSKPIAIFAPNLEIAQKFLEFDKKSIEIANNFLPGALTLVLKAKNTDFVQKIPKLLVNNSFIGLRIPNNEFCEKLLGDFGGILAVTSANISNKDCANNINDIKEYFQDNLDLIIDAGDLGSNASTVIKIDNENIEFLRQGAIDLFPNKEL